MTLNDFLKKLKKIEFHTRMNSQETIAGAYHSAFKGRGMSFSECKPYEDGDDVRYIDWHASARHQGLFVRQFVEERELSVYVVLDLSAPMHFGSIDKTKAEAAIEAMSVITFSALQNNDKVGMCLFDCNSTRFIPQTKGKSNVVRFIIESLKFNANAQRFGTGCNTLNEILVKTISVLKRRSLVFVISDFCTSGYETTLRHLAYRHEVIPVVVTDPMEKTLPDLGLLQMRDCKTGDMMFVDCSDEAFRDAYSKQYDERQASLKTTFNRTRLTFVRISTNEEIIRPLSGAFSKRASHV